MSLSSYLLIVHATSGQDIKWGGSTEETCGRSAKEESTQNTDNKHATETHRPHPVEVVMGKKNFRKDVRLDYTNHTEAYAWPLCCFLHGSPFTIVLVAFVGAARGTEGGWLARCAAIPRFGTSIGTGRCITDVDWVVRKKGKGAVRHILVVLSSDRTRIELRFLFLFLLCLLLSVAVRFAASGYHP